ncbi:MAG: nitronate monooxygenase family protein [Bacillota bacterium]
MKLPSLVVGDLTIQKPIIQGGMGIGVSRSSLASAVANEGGIGVISGVLLGFLEPDFETNPQEANIRALRKEIRAARELSPNGVLGVNFLVAVNHYDELVKAAVEEGIDIIISGAGLPAKLPEIVQGSKTKIAPIASSGRAAAVICKMWDKRYNRIPDMIVVEGPDAGGHLGFSMEELTSEKRPTLEGALKEVLEEIRPFEEKYAKKIPVVAAGGIFTGEDIARYINLGASAVQISTRFIATNECDAHINFKNAITAAKEGDVEIIKSPVGMPGRALSNQFAEKIKNTPLKIDHCSNCMKSCHAKEANFCIVEALIRAVTGNVEEGLVFTGTNAYRVNEIMSVRDLMNELVSEAEKA